MKETIQISSQVALPQLASCFLCFYCHTIVTRLIIITLHSIESLYFTNLMHKSIALCKCLAKVNILIIIQ